MPKLFRRNVKKVMALERARKEEEERKRKEEEEAQKRAQKLEEDRMWQKQKEEEIERLKNGMFTLQTTNEGLNEQIREQNSKMMESETRREKLRETVEALLNEKETMTADIKRLEEEVKMEKVKHLAALDALNRYVLDKTDCVLRQIRREQDGGITGIMNRRERGNVDGREVDMFDERGAPRN